MKWVWLVLLIFHFLIAVVPSAVHSEATFQEVLTNALVNVTVALLAFRDWHV